MSPECNKKDNRSSESTNNRAKEVRAEGGGGGDGRAGETNSESNISIYWESPEAAKLFGFSFVTGEDVYNGLEARIVLFQNVLNTPHGYKDVVAHDAKDLSEFYIFQIRNKCTFLRKAYEIALKKWGTPVSLGSRHVVRRP